MTVRNNYLGGTDWSETSSEDLYGADLNDTFNEASFGNVPIGSIIPWNKDMTGVPSLPDNWVECDGSTISNSNSPMDGQTLPNLNGDNRFLRGDTTSGGTGGTNEQHNHKWNEDSDYGTSKDPSRTNHLESNSNQTAETYSYDSSGNKIKLSANDNDYRTGNYWTSNEESQPAYYNVVFIMRIY